MQTNHVIRKGLPALAVAFGVAAPAAADTVDFGIQAWPGLTVKTEVASQLLETMGYDTNTTELSSSAIYQGIRNGDIDVSLGA